MQRTEERLDKRDTSHYNTPSCRIGPSYTNIDHQQMEDYFFQMSIVSINVKLNFVNYQSSEEHKQTKKEKKRQSKIVH